MREATLTKVNGSSSSQGGLNLEVFLCDLNHLLMFSLCKLVDSDAKFENLDLFKDLDLSLLFSIKRVGDSGAQS